MGWSFPARGAGKDQPIITTLERFPRSAGRDRGVRNRPPGVRLELERQEGCRLFDEVIWFRDDDQLGAQRLFVPHRYTSPLALPGLVLLEESCADTCADSCAVIISQTYLIRPTDLCETSYNDELRWNSRSSRGPPKGESTRMNYLLPAVFPDFAQVRKVLSHPSRLRTKAVISPIRYGYSRFLARPAAVLALLRFGTSTLYRIGAMMGVAELALGVNVVE